MDDYVSEEQRVEALKKWWQTNASSIFSTFTSSANAVYRLRQP